MATKAETFKAQQQVEARNANRKAEKRGGAELESSAKRPSRKSTRGSVDHTKRTTNLQNRAMMRQQSPSSRATARRH